MASRRTRIKGIANIPLRKKLTPNENNCINNENLCDEHENIISKGNDCVIESNKRTVSKVQNVTEENQSHKTENKKVATQDIPNDNTSINDADIPNIEESVKNATQSNNKSTVERKAKKKDFLKPVVNLNCETKRHIKHNREKGEIDISDEVKEKEPLSKDSSTEIKKPPLILDKAPHPSNYIPQENLQKSEVILNETQLFAPSSSSLTFSSGIKKILPDIQNNVSDSEYPPPPPSPSKINRTRIKAIPRLSQRKTSFSASESEDETRKYGRIRNNSVCSIASTTGPESVPPLSDASTAKDAIPVLQKKISRTDQSRKLAEARKEFHKRFGSNNPDKQKLKMIDLIFYNPTTNPMSPKTHQAPVEKKTIVDNDANDSSEEVNENIDDPEKESDLGNSMPVPQIKIGPSGEIILDEKSLVIENIEVVKQKEKIQNSELIDGNFDTGYGIYRKATRSKEWGQKETLRFYKALNLIGTDFTLMTQLFPKRTRRELKLKFKKEEKINRHLVDKAIMQPCNYNFVDLKREIQIEEEEEAALQKLREDEIEQRKLDRQFRNVRKRKGKGKESVQEQIEQPSEDILPQTIQEQLEGSLNTITNEIIPKKHLKTTQKRESKNDKPSRPKKPKIKKLNIRSVLDDDSDADVSDIETQSEAEDEVMVPALYPTRSGRIPKITRRYITSSEIEILNKRRSSTSSLSEHNSEKLVPGAVVIMTEEDSAHKVFMVTPDKKLTPLQLDSDIVLELLKTQDLGDTEKIVVPPLSENNLTIPARSDTSAYENQELVENT